MLHSLRGMRSNWLPQCPIKSSPRPSTDTINRGYKQPGNHNMRLAVIISVSQINYLTTSRTEMETRPVQAYQQECYSRIVGNRVLIMGMRIRAKPGFSLSHCCAQMKVKHSQKWILAPVTMSDHTEFPPLTSDHQQEVVARLWSKAADRRAITPREVAVAS